MFTEQALLNRVQRYNNFCKYANIEHIFKEKFLKLCNKFVNFNKKQ